MEKQGKSIELIVNALSEEGTKVSQLDLSTLYEHFGISSMEELRQIREN